MIIRASSEQPHFCFTPEHPPRLDIEVDPVLSGGLLRVEVTDLLTREQRVEHLPITAGRATCAPSLPFGVHRCDLGWVPSAGAEWPANSPIRPAWKPIPAGAPVPGRLRQYLAYAPAAYGRDLPDSWPLGCHARDGRLLPGFKWYRYFTDWSYNHPAPGRFDWSDLDPVADAVRRIGGRLVIAGDASPAWACTNGLPSPDFPRYLAAWREYLEALRARYDDGSGVIGGLDVWNEPNADLRWKGTIPELVEMTRVVNEVAKRWSTPVRVLGINLSAGPHAEYVNQLVAAGVLAHCDVAASHWYEELHCYEYASLPSNLLHHAAIISHPMARAGFAHEIWNAESGISSVEREDGLPVDQDDLCRRAEAQPGFDPLRPWLVDRGGAWRHVSERRAAAEFVAGIAMLMAVGVSKTFVYVRDEWAWLRDGCTSLQWASLNAFGHLLRGVDHRRVAELPVEVLGGPADRRAVAYRFGDPAARTLIVTFCFQSDLHIGRSKIWQRWLPPRPIRITLPREPLTIHDLYLRHARQAEGGDLELEVGEEPVFICAG